MKKVISLLLTTAMLCGGVGAYDISGGLMQAAPEAVRSDLTGSLKTLGMSAPTVTGTDSSGFTATLGSEITVHASGTTDGTRAIGATLRLSDPSVALRYSQDFGAVCGAVMSLVSPGVSSAVVNNSLKLEDTAPVPGGANLRTFYTNKALFTYEVTPVSVRFTALAYPDNAQGVQLVVNDNFLSSLRVPPKIVEGSTLVPVRGIFEQLGAEVTWDQSTLTATMKKDDIDVRVTIGSKTAYVNGQAKTLDVPAQLDNGSTLVPVRFISESLGALVGWCAQPQTVVVSARA